MTQQKKKVEQTIMLNLITKQLKALPSMQLNFLDILVRIDGIQEMDLGKIEIDELMMIYDQIMEEEHKIYNHIECVHGLIKRIRLSKGHWHTPVERDEMKEGGASIRDLLSDARTANLPIVSLVAELERDLSPARLVSAQPEIERGERQLQIYLKTNERLRKQCLKLPAIPAKSPPMGF